MKRFLICVVAAGTVGWAISPAQAQVPGPAAAPQQVQGYYGTVYRYPFPAPTPEDAYRQGLINRWDLQRYEGPQPQALQGPSVDGSRGGEGGGGRE